MSAARTIARALFVAVNLLLAAAMIEALLVVLLHAPALTARMPAGVRTLAQQVYRHFNRMLVQFDDQCARYDPEVTYTLKPGTCRFANLEFDTTLNVNRQGLRDSDAALDGPEIIVLGDSHAMGWGVNQSESFPAVLAERTGTRVLNAAISSYATVREMRMLDRLDTSKLRVLVIQYADNDVIENRTFKEKGNHLPITDQATYQGIVQYYRRQQSYYPFKYLYRLTMKLTKLEAPEPDQTASEPLTIDGEVGLFLNALGHAGHTRLEGVTIIVLEVNQDLTHIQQFTSALSAAVAKGQSPFPTLTPFDATTAIHADDFYVLDDHMTAKGHRALGEALAKVIQPR
jgi:lysophospholipase L1-like esterase